MLQLTDYRSVTGCGGRFKSGMQPIGCIPDLKYMECVVSKLWQGYPIEAHLEAPPVEKFLNLYGLNGEILRL